MPHRGRSSVVAMVLALVLAGCPDETGFVDETSAGPAFDDAQVLEIVRALEHGLLQSVVAVRGRLHDAEARLLADDVLAEARAGRERAIVLGERLELPLVPTPLSEELERTAEVRLERWIDAKGALASDWLLDQMDAQRAALDTIDAHLLPSARAPEVRELVRDLRRLSAEHLERAQACVGRS